MNPNILRSIDRLNSWVRSDSARRWHLSSPRWAIYDWKHDAVKRAIAAGECEWRGIRLMLTCRDCSGAGKYVNGYGDTYPHCRRCSSTGKTTLYFLVTAIDEFVWHTPLDKTWGFAIPNDWYKLSSLSTDWEPNQKGRDLDTCEVAGHLNTLENAVAAGEIRKPGSHGVYDYGDWIGEHKHENYKLYLGDSGEICQLCGHIGVEKANGLKDGHYHGCSREHIAWSAWACDACRAAYGSDCSIFKAFPIPHEKLQHPEIRRWLERRVAAQLLEA